MAHHVGLARESVPCWRQLRARVREIAAASKWAAWWNERKRTVARGAVLLAKGRARELGAGEKELAALRLALARGRGCHPIERLARPPNVGGNAAHAVGLGGWLLVGRLGAAGKGAALPGARVSAQVELRCSLTYLKYVCQSVMSCEHWVCDMPCVGRQLAGTVTLLQSPPSGLPVHICRPYSGVPDSVGRSVVVCRAGLRQPWRAR